MSIADLVQSATSSSGASGAPDTSTAPTLPGIDVPFTPAETQQYNPQTPSQPVQDAVDSLPEDVSKIGASTDSNLFGPTTSPDVFNAVNSLPDKPSINQPKIVPAPDNSFWADQNLGGEVKNFFTALPKATIDVLGPGKILDFLNTPEGEKSAANLDWSDFRDTIVPTIGKFFAQIPADYAGVFTGPKTYNIPGIGPVDNIEKQASDAVANGENPYVTIIKSVPQSIFDGLFVAGIADKVFSPRESVIATGVKTNDLPAGSEVPGDKSFRLSSTPKTTSSSIPTKALDLLQEQGVKFKNYNPKLPTFFRQTPKGNGVILGEIVQVKPSYFDIFKSKFGGDISKVPESETTTIYEKPTTINEVKKNIESATTGKPVPVPIDTTDVTNIANQIKTQGEATRSIESNTPPVENQIIVGRHGDINAVDDNIAHGQIENGDTKLNPEGRQQAVSLGQDFEKQGVTKIVSSDLTRGKQTASIASSVSGAPIENNPKLRTWDIGKLDGEDKSTAEPQLQYFRTHPNEVVPGGESYGAFKDRVAEGIREVQANNPNEKIGYVLHNEILKSMGHNFQPGEVKTVALKVKEGDNIKYGTGTGKRLGSGYSKNISGGERAFRGGNENLGEHSVDALQTRLLSEYKRNGGNDHSPDQRTQADKIISGNEVIIDKDTPIILKALGLSDIFNTKLSNSFNNGGIEKIQIGESIDGMKDVYAAYIDTSNAIFINGNQIKSDIIQSGDILNHEINGHSWYYKLSPEGRRMFFEDLKTKKDILKQAWQSSGNNTHARYWNETVKQINRYVEHFSTRDISNTILKFVGLEKNKGISLDDFINQSLDLDKTISIINRELSLRGKDPIPLKAEDTWAIREHNAVIAENAPKLTITNDSPIGKYVEDINNGTLKFGKNDLPQEGSALRVMGDNKELSDLRDKLETAQGHLDMAVANQEVFGDKVPELKAKVDDLRKQIAETKYPPSATSRDVLANIEKRTGVKPVEIAKIQNQISRESMSLAAAKEMPEAHLKAYGEDRVPKYEARIKELQGKLKDATGAPGLPKAPTIRVSSKDIEIPQDLYHRQVSLDLRSEELALNPASNLSKYVAKSGEFKGELPEVTGQINKSVSRIQNSDVIKWIKQGDDIATQFGFENSEDARNAYNAYKAEKEKIKAEGKDLRKDLATHIATEKVRIATERFNQMGDKAIEKERTKEEKIAQRKEEAESLANYKNFVETYAKEASLPTSLDEVIPPKVRGGLQSPVLDLAKWKDKSVPRLGRETFERNVENVAPHKDDVKIKDFLIDKVRENETEKVKFNNKLRTEAKEKIQSLGLRRGTLDAELIQKLGEGLIQLNEVQRLAPKKWSEIQEAANYYRKQYDMLIDKWNPIRKKFGYDEVPKRKDYFRHFDEINFITKNYGLLRKLDELPTELAGKTEFFKPGKPFTTAEMSRTGRQTKYDAIAGFDNYIDGVSRQIFHTDSIQRGRALENYIEKSAKVGARIGEPLQLQHFIANLREYVNNGLAGKTSFLDRPVEGLLGRPVVNAVQTISKLIGKNIIVGNLSTALSHLVTIPLIGATTDKIPLMKGLMTTFTAPLKADPFHVIDGQESSFLVRRYPIEQTIRTRPQTAEHALSYLFEITDKFKARLAVSAKYYENIGKGMDPQTAMKEADRYAGKVIGDYSMGQRPNVMNAKLASIFAQFQLGLNDSLSVLFHDIPGSGETFTEDAQGNEKSKKDTWGVVSKFVQFAIFSYLFNEVLKNIRGAGKGLDPIDFGGTLLGLTPEGQGKAFGARASTAATTLAGELPFISMFTGNFPLSTAFSGITKKFKAGDYKGGATDLAALFASPIGGGLQAKKTVQGLQAYNQGYVTSKTGTPTFGIPHGFWSAVQAGVFGPSSSPTAQAYYQSIGAPSAAKNTYDEIQKLMSEGKTAEATAITEAMTPKEYGAYKAEKTRASERAAIPEAQKILDLLNAGKTAEATAITSAMTPEEYKIYKGAKAMILKATSGIASNNNNGLATFEGHATYYGGSTGPDITKILGGNSDDGTIASYNPNGDPVYARDVQLEASRRAELIKQDPYWSVTASQYDHIIPLGAGGTNTANNVQLISKKADDGNQLFENYLVGLYRTGGISRANAAKASLDYKINKTVSLTDVMNGTY